MPRPVIAALLAALACLAAAPVASANSGHRPQRPDFAYNILPPGQFGGAGLTKNSQDQIPLYDGLTPLRGNVTEADIPKYFKREDFTPTGATTVVPTPERPDLRIVRDEFGVPHVYANTRSDLWYGVGLVTGQDRWLLMLLGRGPARAAVADIPGVDAFSLVTNGPEFVPSAQSEALVSSEKQKLVDTYGDKGRQILQGPGGLRGGRDPGRARVDAALDRERRDRGERLHRLDLRQRRRRRGAQLRVPRQAAAPGSAIGAAAARSPT